jgi:hypothetical protein
MEIAIVITRQVGPGIFSWEIRERGLTGKSRQPLVDGCLALLRDGSSPSDFPVMVWTGRPGWALRAKIGVASLVTVAEERKGSSPRFVPRREWLPARLEKHDEH